MQSLASKLRIKEINPEVLKLPILQGDVEWIEKNFKKQK